MERTPGSGSAIPRAAGPPRDQAGVALLIVLVVLFIVAVLMVDIALTASTARQSATNASSEFLMDAAIEGRFLIFAEQIVYDAGEPDGIDSLNDRWVKEEYAEPREEGVDDDPDAPARDADEDEPARLLGDTTEVKVTRNIEDEERKFNLNLLLQTDKAKLAEAQERFAILLDQFRDLEERKKYDVSRTRADQLAEAVIKYLQRTPPGEGEKGKIPVPGKRWRILTPDELINVEGFFVEEGAYGAREILYDYWDPEEVRAWEEDPENVEKPEKYPGLLHYLTLWSGTAWGTDDKGAAVFDPASWQKINVNTAEGPVLATLFKLPGDQKWADGTSLCARILEYREEVDQEAAQPSDTGGSSDTEATENKQVFKGAEDLKKVDGLADALGDEKRCFQGLVTYASGTFSIDLTATHKRATKQVRYVIRRHAKGFTTLLREERADPALAEKEPDDEEDGGDVLK